MPIDKYQVIITIFSVAFKLKTLCNRVQALDLDGVLMQCGK